MPEYLAVFPEDAEKFTQAIEEYHFMQHQLEANYDAFKHIESQKEFALIVHDMALSCVMFKARKLGTNVIHEFNQYPVNKRADWIKERIVK